MEGLRSSDEYGNHPEAPKSISNHAKIQHVLSFKDKRFRKYWLNKYSRDYKQAFRVNGTTYDGKN